jgi:hypothetical protein
MLFPLHHTAGADSLIGAIEEGTASRVEFASSISRRQVKQQQAVSLPSESGRLGAPTSCGIEQPWNLSRIHNAARTQRGHPDRPGAEFVAADRLLARLTLGQVRPCHRSIADAEKQSCSSRGSGLGRVSVSLPKPFFPRSGRVVRSVQATSPDPLQKPIETLFAELARRRLRNFAAEEISG